uniref:JmjC domain-containing protein n=1 Tax=Peronospora matthiolae TaxID=2874970 RepID=A0AAV1VM44_9STRA
MDSSRPRDPVCLPGFAAQCVAPSRLSQFTPACIHQLSSIQEHRDTLVEVACKPRSSGCYCGNDSARQSIELRFGDFIDYFQAAFTKHSHWLQTVEELDFYLAQCPIAVLNSSEVGTKATLPAVRNDVCIPACLCDEELIQVNLWMTVRPSRTALHYDAYHNVLVVLYGRKVVTLYAPSETAKLYPFPVHSKSVNHSQVDVVQPDLAKHARFSEALAQQFTITAGDALVIPEGWWHSVESDGFTIAVNYWWNGMREQLVADKRMVPYYARVMLEELVVQQCEERLLAFRSPSGAGIARKYDDECKAVAAILATTDQGCHEQVMLSLESRVFLKTQEHLATNYVAEWRRLLANASVNLAAALVKCWESDDVGPGVLGTLYGALGDEEESIKGLVATKHAQFLQDCASDMYRSYFG